MTKKPTSKSLSPKTPHPTTPADSPPSLKKSFDAFLAEANLLPKEKVAPLKVDVNLVFANVQQGILSVQPQMIRLRSELPMLNVDGLMKLPMLAEALLYAHGEAVRHGQPVKRAEMEAKLVELQTLRESMLLQAEVFALVGLIPEARVAQIRAGKGLFDAAQDGVALADLYGAYRGQIAGKHPFGEAQIARAAELGHALMKVMHRRSAEGHRPDAHRALCPRPLPLRRRARPRQDAARQHPRRRALAPLRRIQFTPDLMPSDITGTDILEEDHATGRRHFKFIRGPIFANLLLADEINRTPPKTQAALLQAMQEGRVTAAGQTYPLTRPSSSLRPRTRSSRRAPTRCPRRSSTASCSWSRSASRRSCRPSESCSFKTWCCGYRRRIMWCATRCLCVTPPVRSGHRAAEPIARAAACAWPVDRRKPRRCRW
jgi:hypothetical protein